MAKVNSRELLDVILGDRDGSRAGEIVETASASPLTGTNEIKPGKSYRRTSCMPASFELAITSRNIKRVGLHLLLCRPDTSRKHPLYPEAQAGLEDEQEIYARREPIKRVWRCV